MLGQVRLGQVMLGQVRFGQKRADSIAEENKYISCLISSCSFLIPCDCNMCLKDNNVGHIVRIRNYSIKINKSGYEIRSQHTCFGFFNCNYNTNSSEATVLQPTALPHRHRLAILTAWNHKYVIRQPRRMRRAVFTYYAQEKRNATKRQVQKSEEANGRRITLQKYAY